MMGPVNQQPMTTNLLPSPTNNNHHHHPGSVNDLLIAGGTSSRLVASANPCSSSHSPSMETPAVAASHLLLDQFYSSNGSNGGGAMASTAAMAAAAAAANSYYHYQHHHQSQNASSVTATGNSSAAVELKPDVDVLSKLNSYSAASWMMQQQQQAPHPSLYSTPLATNSDSFPYASPFGCHYPLPSSASFNNYVMNGFGSGSGSGSHAGNGPNNVSNDSNGSHALYKPFLTPAVSIPNGGGGDRLSVAALALNRNGGGNATAAATAAAAINQSLFQQWSQANGGNGSGYCITSAPAAALQSSTTHLQHSQAHLSDIKPACNAKLKGVLHGTSHLVTPLSSHPHSRMISRGPPSYPTGKGTNNVRVRTSDKYRTVYTEPQRFELEKEFRSNEFINSDRKSELSTYLQLTERQIKIWFQNRRAKERKQKNIVTRKGYR